MSRTAALFRPWLAAVVLIVCSIARSRPTTDVPHFGFMASRFSLDSVGIFRGSAGGHSDGGFSDTLVHRYRDPRIAAAVAMVPFAADFILTAQLDPATGARPLGQ